MYSITECIIRENEEVMVIATVLEESQVCKIGNGINIDVGFITDEVMKDLNSVSCTTN